MGVMRGLGVMKGLGVMRGLCGWGEGGFMRGWTYVAWGLCG